MGRYLALALALTNAGCGIVYVRGTPGAGVDASFVQQWGCDFSAVKANADSIRRSVAGAGRGYGTGLVPQVGWTSCQTLAAVGKPDEVRSYQTTDIVGASWSYVWPCPVCATRSVFLERREAAWIVQRVAW